ncbi:hypothetical protein BVY01_04430 [bacterium I07]|nr:hypothetical protein BVY01_04430 [bacterium I07]
MGQFSVGKRVKIQREFCNQSWWQVWTGITHDLAGPYGLSLPFGEQVRIVGKVSEETRKRRGNKVPRSRDAML